MRTQDDLSPEQAEAILAELAGSLLGRPVTDSDGPPLTEDRYRMLLEQVGAVTFMASFDPGLSEQERPYVSPQIETLLGYTQEEWLGDPTLWYARLHPEDKARWNVDFAATFSAGEAVRKEYRFLAKDGHTVWILGDVRIQRDEETGFPRFIQGVGFDITALKETEEALRQRTVELEAAKEELRAAQERELAVKQREIVRVRAGLEKARSSETLVGSSEAMRILREDIDRFAPSDHTVLVTGESGTGKELVAQALHYSSPRARGPFIAFNCAAITESLLESELMGVEENKVTGVKGHAGKFEQAHGGTIFLDEIGDMPLAMQTKLLRVLEKKPFQRVMGTKWIEVNVRVVCATNRDLEKMEAEGKFRTDLLYRIKTLQIAVPPLRAREGDVLELADHFLAEQNREQKRQVSLSDAAKNAIKACAWPGNVRELKSEMIRAVLRCRADAILPDDLSPAVAGPRPQAPAASQDLTFYEQVEKCERTIIVSALKEAKGVKAQAARAIHLSINTFSDKMRQYAIVALKEPPWVKIS